MLFDIHAVMQDESGSRHDSVEMKKFWNLSKFINHNGAKMVDVRVLNVNKLTEGWTKMEVGKLCVRAA